MKGTGVAWWAWRVALVAMVLMAGPGYAGNAKNDIYRSMKLFTDVVSIVRENYVGKVESNELIQGAINGMLQTLDPHSSLLTPEDFQEMRTDTRGEFGGIGVEITVRDNMLTVVAPIEGTPADQAGILPGDRIVKIDGKLTQEMSLSDAVRAMRGPKGTTMTITILRGNQTVPKNISLTRKIIKIVSVRARMLEKGFGYVRIAQFQENTASDLKRSLSELFRKNQRSLDGLVLDLRNNPGGLLDEAVRVADVFLTKGLVVYTEGREPASRKQFFAQNDGQEPLCPVVVLINGGSASASEIVAGALQDHKRAVILGTTSFGKGSVQTIIPLIDNYGLRLTTALYYTPLGRSIQARGIVPDIVTPPLRVHAETSPAFREADLERHLEAPDEKREPNSFSGDAAISDDYQLLQALNVLKSWRILRKAGETGAGFAS
ncbi:MAG: S41 family peptidase [Deltaproteobacteria bacterium]|nr:S41 family peptidase [Deltaproteobacteria bacterium]